MKIPDDPFVRELLPEFIEEWITDLNTKFPVIIETRNTDDLYRFGHTLKGSCFQFGIDDVAELGITLMGYAKAGYWENATALYTPLLEGFTEMRMLVEAV